MLYGIPVGIKDVFMVKGMRTTAGSRILENYTAVYTATAVEKLLSAGIIIVGKNNNDEFAMGASCENSAFHPTYNPYDLKGCQEVPVAVQLRVWLLVRLLLALALIQADLSGNRQRFAGPWL